MKKRDKKKFKRKDLNISNVKISSLDDFIDDEIITERRAEKKPVKKGNLSFKNNMELVRGRIVELFTNYRCRVLVNGRTHVCHVSGRLRNYNLETRNIMAVGDWVRVDRKAKYRIEEIEERKNTLNRYTEDNFQKKIIVAANLDNVVIISSCRQPDLNLGLVDRVLCAALIDGIEPVICINKVDLEEVRSSLMAKTGFYKRKGYEVVLCSALTGEGTDKLRNILKDKDTVFLGHSGVGKSSLINILQPGINLKEGKVSDYTGKGVHTTTRSRIISWDFGGSLIDTPGIKTLTLHSDMKNEIKYVFPGLKKISVECYYPDCTHIHEDDCAVIASVNNGDYDHERYESYCRIMNSFPE